MTYEYSPYTVCTKMPLEAGNGMRVGQVGGLAAVARQHQRGGTALRAEPVADLFHWLREAT